MNDENSALYDVSVTDIFYARILQEVFERHTPEFSYPEQWAEDTVQEALSGFGYQFEGEYGAYKLYQGKTQLSDSIVSFRDFQMSPLKTSISMLVQLQNKQKWLLQKDRFDLYYDGALCAVPAYAGENLLTTNIQYIDGTPVAEEAGYDTTFNWHLVNGKPTYLFQKGDKYGISYDGKELPLTYDYIERWDCIYGTPFYAFGAHGRDDLLTFFAQRDGHWYFVQVGNFAP